MSLPQQLAVAAVVEQQAAHIPAEWLLQLACLLRSHARLSGDLRIARRLDDCRIGRGRRGSRDRYGGSARRQQRPAVCCRRCSGARSSVTSSGVRAEGLGFIAAKAVFYLDWPFASGYPDYSGGQSSTPSWRSSSPARAPARVPVGSFTAHCHVVVRYRHTVRRSSAADLAHSWRNQHTKPPDLQQHRTTNTAKRYKRPAPSTRSTSTCKPAVIRVGRGILARPECL